MPWLDRFSALDMSFVGDEPASVAEEGREDSALEMADKRASNKLPNESPASVNQNPLFFPPKAPPSLRAEPSDEQQYIAMLTAQDQANDGSTHLLGSRRPKPKKMWQKRHVKLLVVGDSGLGKTTLVRCLLAVPGEPIVLHDGSMTCFDEFQKDPRAYLSTVEWDDEDDHVHWTYQIQDTPGYGDDLNLTSNIERVRRHIQAQNRQWLKLESSASRGELSQVVDPRVDVCIFCLPPHRVRNIDILFMYEISQLVPILPVVTKADTMTVKEGINYRRELNQRLQYPCLPGRTKPISLFQFSPDTLAACGISDNAIASAAAMRPPFLVVCSNAYNEERLQQEQPELWPERRYMWGTSEAMNPQHSDLLLLRRLLLQEGVEEISRSKTTRYEEWRKSELKQIRPLRKLAKYVFTTALVLGVIGGIVAATGKVDLKEAAVAMGKKFKKQAEGAVDAVSSVLVVPEADEAQEETVEETTFPPTSEAPPPPPEAKPVAFGGWFKKK